MSQYYRKYPQEKITSKVIESIDVGDFIKINDEKRGMKVRAISQNYILLANKCFGTQYLYSIMSKHPAKFTKNNIIKGLYYRGIDDRLFGFSSQSNLYASYDFENVLFLKDYLQALELGAISISQRNATAINTLYIRKGN